MVDKMTEQESFALFSARVPLEVVVLFWELTSVLSLNLGIISTSQC